MLSNVPQFIRLVSGVEEPRFEPGQSDSRAYAPNHYVFPPLACITLSQRLYTTISDPLGPSRMEKDMMKIFCINTPNIW